MCGTPHTIGVELLAAAPDCTAPGTHALCLQVMAKPPQIVNTVNKLNSQWWAPLSQKYPSLLSNRACHGWIRCQSKCLVSVPDIPYVYKSRTYIQLNLLHMWLARFYAENLISFGPVHLQYLLYIVLYSVVILLVSAALPEAEKRQGYFKNSPKRLRLQFDVM